MNRAVFLSPLAAAASLAACSQPAPPPQQTPSVAVSLTPPSQGSLPATVTAFGAAAPSLTGAKTLSIAQPGQVTMLAVAPGLAVHAGQVLATFATAPTARSTYQQASNALVAAQKQRATTAALLSQQLATTDQLVQADKAVADAQAAVNALGAEGAGASSHTLTAPYDGVVTVVSVAGGDRIQPGAPILTIARATGIVVTVGVDPVERVNIRLGQSATLERLSGTGKPLVGRVVRVDSALNPRTRLIDVDVGFPANALLPGEGMKVAITTGQVSGWVVPHVSVVTANGPSRIFQAVGGKAKAVPVSILLSSHAGDVVSGPIDRTKPIIVNGAYQVNAGDAVRSSH